MQKKIVLLIAIFAFPLTLIAHEKEENSDCSQLSFERDQFDNSGHSLMVDEKAHDEGKEGVQKKGKFVLRSQLKTGLGYNTNPYLVPTADIENSGGFVFKMRPVLSFNGEAEWAAFDVGAAAEGQVVFGTAQDPRIMLLNGLLIAKGELNPRGIAGLKMDATIEETREVEDLFMDSLTELLSTFRAGGKLRPGNGVITIDVNGEVKIKTYFDVGQPISGKFTGDPSIFNDESYSVGGRLSWRFRQNMDLYADVKYGTWFSLVDSQFVTLNPLWFNLGVSGLIAPNVKANLNAGYANSFIRVKASDALLEGVTLPFAIGGEVTWKIAQGSDLFLKVERSLHSESLFLEVYKTAIETDFRQKFADRFTLVIAPSAKLFEYGKPLAEDGTGRLAGNHRSDIVLGLREELMFFVTKWASVGLSHKARLRWTNAEDLQVFTEEGKLADSSGNFSSSNCQNEFLVFGSLYY